MVSLVGARGGTPSGGAPPRIGQAADSPSAIPTIAATAIVATTGTADYRRRDDDSPVLAHRSPPDPPISAGVPWVNPIAVADFCPDNGETSPARRFPGPGRYPTWRLCSIALIAKSPTGSRRSSRGERRPARIPIAASRSPFPRHCQPAEAEAAALSALADDSPAQKERPVLRVQPQLKRRFPSHAITAGTTGRSPCQRRGRTRSVPTPNAANGFAFPSRSRRRRTTGGSSEPSSPVSPSKLTRNSKAFRIRRGPDRFGRSIRKPTSPASNTNRAHSSKRSCSSWFRSHCFPLLAGGSTISFHAKDRQ